MTNAIAVLATNAWMVAAATNLIVTSGWSVAASSIDEIRLAEGGRMTQPIEAVCIVTNVTAWSNEITVPWGTQSYIQTTAQHSNLVVMPYTWDGTTLIQPATERTETTEVVEVRTLRFYWDDKEEVIRRERVLSRKVRRWVRKDNWVEE